MTNKSITQPILQLGSVGLRQRSRPIPDPTAPDIQALIDTLIATALAKDGVGIAAPQVAAPQRLFVVASRPNPRYPAAPTMAPTAMINPAIVARSSEQVKGWEGCLSVPGWRGCVSRAQQIEVTYWDRSGKAQRRVLSDFVARIFQHELDHLDGVLFLDRIAHSQDLLTEIEYGDRLEGRHHA